MNKFKRGKSGIRETMLRKEVRTVEFLNTGSVLLNLACSQEGRTGGIPRGRITNIVGDGSSGKCEKNSYILTEGGMIKIDNILPDAKEGITEYRQAIYGHTNPVKTSIFYKEKVKKTVWIETECGFEKEGTEKHPIMIWDEIKLSFKLKKLSEIKKGDYIAVRKGMNFFPKAEYIFSDKEKKIHNGNTNVIKFAPPDKMTNDIALFLGYMVADGNITSNTVQISNSQERNKKSILKALLSMDIKGKNKGKGVRVSRIEFRNFIFNLFNRPKKFTARFKEVPQCILQSSRNHQAMFLRALIDCDGYFSRNSNLEYYTASFELAKQVQMMLLNFGIFSSLNKKWNTEYKRDYYCVRICAEDMQVFSKEIGTIKYNFSKISSSKGMVSSVPNLLSKIWKDIEDVRKKHSWCKNGVIKGTKKRFPNFRNTYRGENCSHREIRKFISLFENYLDVSFYKNLLNFHFIKVTEKKVKKKETMVYDFTVPEGHLFWSGGMISHNTLLAFEICASALVGIQKEKSLLYPPVKKVNIVYDNVEGVMDLPLEKMFGRSFEKSIGWEQSVTCEEFGRRFMRLCKEHKKGEFLLYVVDSLDALIPKVYKDKVDKSIKSNTEIDEGFGAEKAKYFSKTFFKMLCDLMSKKDITLICISQVREKIGISFGDKLYRTGGKALDFYTHLVLWLAQKEKLKTNDLVWGVSVRANVKRSKVAIPFRIVDFPIILNYGIDNIGSMINYLYGEEKKKIEWRGEEYSKDDLISLVDGTMTEYDDLVNRVCSRWVELEAKAFPERRVRFQ